MGQLAPVPEPAPLIPPQALEAEEAVLGAAMLSPGAIIACREILTDDGREFYRESHARIWRAALALSDRGEPVDAITITDQLEAHGELEDVGGRVRMHELAALVPATANASHYARIVAETSELRDFIRAGGELARLGWERPGDLDELRTRRDQIIDNLRAGITDNQTITIESWAQFERSATETIPMLIDGLWPEDGLGILGAPPKKGKTWVAIDLAISVATGTPFLSHFTVQTPQPVVLLAAEGHRAAIRGRIGALAHGHNIDPQTNDLLRRNLHIVYKPAGINLADPAWIRTTRDLVRQVGARLLIVDVLRAAAVLKENSNDEFRDLFRALTPLQTDGCALALLHHFGKLTELSKDRTPGERLAGAGAVYGAFDVGVFITKSDKGARELRLEFETRDVVAPEPLGVHLDGDPSGPLGGFVFTDTATWRVLDEAPADADLTGNTAELIAWLEQQPERTATTDEIMYGLDLSERQIRSRRPYWTAAGVTHQPARGGTPATYFITSKLDDILHDIGQDDMSPSSTHVAQETLDLQDFPDANGAARHSTTFDNVALPETHDLQAKDQGDKGDLYYVEERPADAEHLNETAADDEIDWTTP